MTLMGCVTYMGHTEIVVRFVYEQQQQKKQK